MDSIECVVYKSKRKLDTYLYLSNESDFNDLPELLRDSFGEPEKVMDLHLTPERRLAREDTAEVLRNLREQGYHLQLPPGQYQSV